MFYILYGDLTWCYGVHQVFGQVKYDGNMSIHWLPSMLFCGDFSCSLCVLLWDALPWDSNVSDVISISKHCEHSRTNVVFVTQQSQQFLSDEGLGIARPGRRIGDDHRLPRLLQ